MPHTHFTPHVTHTSYTSHTLHTSLAPPHLIPHTPHTSYIPHTHYTPHTSHIIWHHTLHAPHTIYMLHTMYMYINIYTLPTSQIKHIYHIYTLHTSYFTAKSTTEHILYVSQAHTLWFIPLYTDTWDWPRQGFPPGEDFPVWWPSCDIQFCTLEFFNFLSPCDTWACGFKAGSESLSYEVTMVSSMPPPNIHTYTHLVTSCSLGPNEA